MFGALFATESRNVQSDMTAWSETSEKERFSGFPHTTTREEKPETSSNFDIFNTLSNSLECHKVSSFPHRHGDATGKPAARDKTRKIHGCRKTSTPALPTRLPPIFTVDFRLSISNLAYSEPGSPFPDCRGIN